MTTNAIKAREIASNERINSQKLRVQQIEGAKDRENRITSAVAGGAASGLAKAAGSIGAAAISNSPDWYKKWPGINTQLGDIPQLFYNGLQYKHLVGIPTIVTYYYMDTYGSVQSRDGFNIPEELFPINEAALRYQTNLYSYNSVLASVAASDVMQYNLACIDLVTVFKQIKRACRAYKTFDPSVQELNRKLLTAMGFDPDDFTEHYKDYIAWMDEAIPSFNSDIALPAEMSLIDRKVFLCSNVWAENYGKNSCVYLTRPLCYHVWNEATGVLTPYRYPQLITYAAITSAFRLMKTALVGSSNIVELIRNIKSGVRNGLKLYTEDLFVEGALALAPVDEVLHQIMNATLVPHYAFGTGAVIVIGQSQTNFINYRASLPGCRDAVLKQDANGYLIPCSQVGDTQANDYTYQELTYSNTASIPQHGGDFEPEYVNFLKDDVSYDDILVATRMRVPVHWSHSGNGTNITFSLSIRYLGTEVFLGADIYSTTGNGELSGMSDENLTTFANSAAALSNAIRRAYGVDCVPEFIELSGTNNLTSGSFTQSIKAEAHRWHSAFQLPLANLKVMHEVAVKSEFYIGPMGSITATGSDGSTSTGTTTGKKSRRNKRNKQGKPENKGSADKADKKK